MFLKRLKILRKLLILTEAVYEQNCTIIHNQKEIKMTLQDILDKVAKEETVEQSIITLLTSVKAELDAAIASNDPAALQALSDKLDADTKAMSDAVVANTSAAPPANS